MDKAFDEAYGKIVYANECGPDTILAKSRRFTCLCCYQYVTLTGKSPYKEQHFRHTSGDPLDCENRVASGDYDPIPYNPMHSFGLPMYLIGNSNYQLKIGFLPRTTGYAVLRDKLNNSATMKIAYSVQSVNMNHYVYLNVDRILPDYYLSFAERTYRGEGLSEANIFLEKTRRKIRTDEPIYTKTRYILMINKKSDVFKKNEDFLNDDSIFQKGYDFDLDFNRFSVFKFVVDAKNTNDPLYKFITNTLKINVRRSQVDLKFYWPLNSSFHDKRFFMYDNELYVITKNINILKTNKGFPLHFAENMPFSYKLSGSDGLIGWNESSGCMYQLETIKPVKYKTLKPKIEFFDPISYETIETNDISKFSEIGIRANVKCTIIRLGIGLKKSKLETDGLESVASKVINIKKDDIAIYVVYGNKTWLSLTKTINDSLVDNVQKVDVKKVLLLAGMPNNQISINPQLMQLSRKISNKVVKSIIIDSIARGTINEELQNYLMGVLR